MTCTAAKTLGNFLDDINTQNSNPGYVIGQKKDTEVTGNGITQAQTSSKEERILCSDFQH